ncbi:GNAT family N-acetyltransferase [Aquimarina muelleri]|uniref:GNAT family N-acetyltransferase n=1 Tax=Aquimarina muelleri TaxID=279356 RepID=UPI003F687C40
MELETVSLDSSHKREGFECGKEQLDNYLKKQASQDMKKQLAACFVVTEEENKENIVKGYYTLSNAGIPRDLVPLKYQKRFPKSYDSIPATLLGRLARDISYAGQGIGEFLLLDALYNAYVASKKIGSFAVVVDPIDDKAIKFYEKYGFILLPDSEKMFLPMKTVNQLFIEK